jgi:hypothetical protein
MLFSTVIACLCLAVVCACCTCSTVTSYQTSDSNVSGTPLFCHLHAQPDAAAAASPLSLPPTPIDCHHRFTNLSLSQAVRTLQFWLLFGLFMAGVGSCLTFLNNLGQITVALGGAPGDQVVFVSIFAVGNAAGEAQDEFESFKWEGGSIAAAMLPCVRSCSFARPSPSLRVRALLACCLPTCSPSLPVYILLQPAPVPALLYLHGCSACCSWLPWPFTKAGC